MDAPPTAIRRAARASLWIALALAAWTAYLLMSDPAAKFAILILLFVPPMFAAYYVAALLPAWLAFKVSQASRRQALTSPAVAVIAAAGLVAPFLIFHLFVPHYFKPEYRAAGIELVPAADFVAPWGSRMVALQIPARMVPDQPAHTLWVAETELTRSEYARLVGKPVEGDPQLPMTSLSREQLEAVLGAMNRAAAGRYRLPTLIEMRLYAGDWWINRYPKWLFRCQSSLAAVEAQPANGLGLRGTVDNAAELVSLQLAERTLYCVTQGGVEPFCGRERVDGGSRYKSVGLSACEDRNADRMWSQPGVGLRVVFSAS